MTKKTILNVHIIPKASSARIQLMEPMDTLRVYVTAVPEDGKANAALLKILSKKIGIAASRLEIIKGHHSRQKKVSIDLEEELVLKALKEGSHF